MIRHPLIAVMAVLSVGFASEALARSGGSGGAGHGGVVSASVSARGVGGWTSGSARGSASAGQYGYRASTSLSSYGGSSQYGNRSLSAYGYTAYAGGNAGRGAYGGTPAYSATGVFVPGNPTQTSVPFSAIYQIERTGAVSRTGRQGFNDRRPGIYSVGTSDGARPNIHVVRVPRG